MEQKPILPRFKCVEDEARAFAQRFPDLAQRANGRIEKAIDLAASGFVFPTDEPMVFYVRSQSGDGGYRVDADAGTCECGDYTRAHVCKHRIATYLAVAAL